MYNSSDDAIRHLFKLAMERGSVKGAGELVRSQVRCMYCAGPIPVKRAGRDVCVDCSKPWEPMLWYDVPKGVGRNPMAHFFDDNDVCVMCRQPRTALFAHQRSRCVHGGINAIARGKRKLGPKADTATELRITLALCVEAMPVWEWRVYGIIHVGMSVPRRALPVAVRKHWRHIPKHHLTEWGVRALIDSGRKTLTESLVAAGLQRSAILDVAKSL